MGHGDWDLWTDEVFATGLHATWIAAVGLLAAAAVPGWSGHHLGFALAVLLGASPAVLLAPARVRGALVDRFGPGVPVAWSIVVVLAVTVGVMVTGGASSPVVLGYALPIAYFSTLYPGRVQLGLLLLVGASYAGVLGLSGRPPTGDVLWYVTVLGTLAFLANRLSRQIRDGHRRELAAHNAAVRRAELIRVVVGAGDGGPLETDAVLEDLLTAARQLGMECAVLFEVDSETGTYHARSANAFDDELGVPRPMGDGVVAQVVRRGSRVVATDGDPVFGRDTLVGQYGLASLVALPLRFGDRIVAVFAAGTRSGGILCPELLEAFELLALRAEHALANAKRLRVQSEMLERRREIDRMKDDFIATASHELRTPVTVVKAATELLTVHWAALGEERRLDLLSRLSHHVGRLDGVVDSLTRFRRLRIGDHELDLRPVSLRAQLTAAIDRFVPNESATVNWHVGMDQAVLSDPQLLQLAVGELLDNVAAHTRSAIDLAVHTIDDHAIVTIHDNGPGLPPNVLLDLTESFRRGGDTHRSETGGLGLGLATAMTAFELLGIRPEVESIPDRGTTWTFQVPLSAGRQPADEISSVQDRIRGSR